MALSKETARCLIEELHRARRELQVLRAVDATVQAFSLALNAHPPSQGVSPDIVWQAEKEIQDDGT